MITTLFGDDLSNLVEQTGQICLSIFMPTGPGGIQTLHDQTTLRNLLGQAETELKANLTPPEQIKAVLKPIKQFLNDELFWKSLHKGLAIFSSPNKFLYYRLPQPVAENLVVGRRFYLKGLLPFISPDGRFYLLALSKQHVRLIEGTRFTAREVELPEGTPTSLAETTKYFKIDAALQFHPGNAPVSGSRPSAMFFGHGGIEDVKKGNLQMFCNQVESGVRKILQEQKVPLVLAGVSYLSAFYRQSNTYPYLVEESLKGNPDDLSPLTLVSKAWPLVEPVYRSQSEQAYKLFAELAGTGVTSTEISEIIPASDQGRVATLFVAGDQQQWGFYEMAEGNVHTHLKAAPGDEDLLDLAVSKTLLNKGEVFTRSTQHMPVHSSIAAIFRY